MRIVTSKQMKQIEQASLRYDLTFHRLMENAGSAAAAFIRRTFHVEGLNCMIFCGGGNNGGDGFVVARKLFEAGANVLTVLVGKPPKSEEAEAMLESAQLMEIPIADFSTSRERVLEVLDQADILVDALYGTGFHGELGEDMRAACRAINDAIAAVVALDIPSGVNCDSGAADDDAVRADFTIAFDSLKLAHMLPQSAALCGRCEVVDIGIPDEAHQGIAGPSGPITAERVWELLPPRDPDSHKGKHGRVLAVCGSAHYRGAAVLAALGALRAGAGLVKVAAIEPVCAAIAAHLLEATLLPLPERDGAIDESAAAPLLTPELRAATAVLIGCGLEDGAHTTELLRLALREASGPVVIDADGINALARNIHVLQEANAPVILTPHPGEMARLCRTTTSDVQANRIGYATQFARKHGVVLALKGRETLVAAPDGTLLVNTSGNAGLAKGGSGDVLAGMVAAFAAQGLSPVDAAACAVHLHGLAADRTAARRSQYAMLPSELLDDLAALFAENGR